LAYQNKGLLKEALVKKKHSVILVLPVFLILVVVLFGGCVQNAADTSGMETQTQIISNITSKEAVTFIENNRDNPDFIILDVRTPKEFAEGYIEGAINLDYYSATFRAELNKLDKNKTYLVYCRSGRRSEGSLDLMRQLGFGRAYNMLGGIINWKANGLPTVK
jgi:rhodanese-related sulfurtransferase